MPIVSVIIPIYNVEDYLERCLHSVLNQTLKDIEVILVNDGSTDNSGGICDTFVDMENRIKVIHKNNSGVSAARNSGIEVASGKYISFMDPDDWAEEKLFESLVGNAVENGSDMVVCGYKRVFENGEIIRFKMNEEIIKIYKTGIIKYLKYDFLQFKHSFCVWNKLYRSDLIKNNKIKFDPQCSYGEDLLFNLIYLFHTNIISSTSKELINYYQRDGSLSHFPNNVLYNAAILVNKYEESCKKYTITNPGLLVFCTEFATAIRYMRDSNDKKYVENCLRSIKKDKLFKSFCMKVLLNKECSKFLKMQGNNFKGRLAFKLMLFMLMIGRTSYVMNKL